MYQWDEVDINRVLKKQEEQAPRTEAEYTLCRRRDALQWENREGSQDGYEYQRVHQGRSNENKLR